jgi:hypothetical protein
MEESYYSQNKEARKEYQKRYYAEQKSVLRRKRELTAELNPESVTLQRRYQRDYYLKNRTFLLAKKKKREIRKMDWLPTLSTSNS